MSKRISYKKESLPIRREVEVLVVGGGPAGIGAAVQAARNGTQVLLLERHGFLGGNITACYVETCNHFLFNYPDKVGGLYREIEEKYKQRFGRSDDIRKDFPAHRFSSEYLKVFLDDFFEENKIDILYHTFAVDVIKEDNYIKGVVIASKSGLEAVLAKIIIDATGDADIAAYAGVEFLKGRESDGLCQPGTLNFRLCGINVDKVLEKGAKYYSDILKRMQEEGTSKLSCPRRTAPMGRITPAGMLSYINFSDVYRIDPTNVEDITKGEIVARRQIMEFINFIKEYWDGFENCELVSFAPIIGFRDSRRIVGEYTLTQNDIEMGKYFFDEIVRYPRFYDMLSLTGRWDKDDTIYIEVEPDREFSIPYRCLLPRSIENLLVAGRCISTEHVAESSIRAISACMATGEAAGTAAALAISNGVSPRNINVDSLRRQLQKQGARLTNLEV